LQTEGSAIARDRGDKDVDMERLRKEEWPGTVLATDWTCFPTLLSCAVIRMTDDSGDEAIALSRVPAEKTPGADGNGSTTYPMDFTKSS
jgi:hypothetical protein